MRRRDFATVTVGAGLGLVAGCAKPCPPPSLPLSGGGVMVDAHCHAFNASDLSPTRFIRQAFLELYPEAAEPPPVSGVEKPDLLDGVISAVLAIVGAQSAPKAHDERRLLRGQGLALPSAGDDARATRQVTERLADYIAEPPSAEVSDPTAPASDRARTLIYDTVVRAGAGGEMAPVSGGGGYDRATRLRIAERFLAASGTGAVPVAARSIDVGQLFKWLPLFRQYRHCLVDDLTARHRRAGWNPVLITPAMVDYGYWLDEQPRSSLASQVAVWAQIAARRGGPAVHGYVAYDPLRAVLHRRGLIREPISPLALVEQALLRDGFLGVKIYPPMGFSATGNATRDFTKIPIPVRVLKRRFGAVAPDDFDARSAELGAELDEAMEDLFKLCEAIDAPIMTHGGPGQASSLNAGRLSDPWRWRPVFERPRPTRPLRVMLAHYGSFEDPSYDPAASGSLEPPLPYERTYEAALERFIGLPGAQSVVIDMSMFTEGIALRGADRQRMIDYFKQLYPAMRGRVVFGTDWTMLGIQKGEERYDAEFQNFLAACDLDVPQQRAVLGENFIRFAGLARGERSRARLDDFHARLGQPDRLAPLDG